MRSPTVPIWRSFVFRFVGAFAILQAGIAVATVAWLDGATRADVVDSTGARLRSVAATAALGIDGDQLAEIRRNEDVEGEAFRTIRGRLESVRAANQLREDQLYVLRPQGDGFAFVVMLQKQTFVGDPYTPPASLRLLYDQVESDGAARASGLYADQHGTFQSGVAGIRDADGRVVAFLHVDNAMDMVLDEIGHRTGRLVVAGAALLAAILLAGAYTWLRVRAKIHDLLGGTEAIRAAQYDRRVAVRGRDELASIAEALNAALAQLKERFEMLKFLPRHTANMIRTAGRGAVGLDVARRVRLVVLESDIRGFSRLSERMSPEETIGMLNLYIRAQAELVAEAGGSIDKFMGDAVLAVFDGEAMEHRALECAAAIQRRVREMNASCAFSVPVHLGVGLSVGEVVLGNMGSEERMEHTVIGPTVNRAARLCSAAGAGELVVDAEVWEAAAASLAGFTAVPESLVLKGFEQPVAAVRLRADEG